MKLTITLTDKSTIALYGADFINITNGILTTPDGSGDVITISMKDVEIIKIT